MTKTIVLLLLVSTQLAIPQQPKQGKWLDTTEDTKTELFVSTGKFILSEDYEVISTHEICASVDGYFLEKSQLGRYDVRFKGMRTYNIFTFTTQYDAEKWVERFCTAESLTSIKNGNGSIR